MSAPGTSGAPPALTSTAPAIVTRGLRRTFGAVKAVDGLDLEIHRGELFGLLGPDGAGKTTLLRLLAGVIAPTAGQAFVLGADVQRDPEAVKRRIGYMPQRFSLYPDLTVLENLHFYADLHTVPPAERIGRSRRLLEFSGLTGFADRPADKLSGGMRQKLALACTLIHEPELLLLDEPTGGVDPVSRREFWRILQELQARGVTILVATPYMDEAERCTRLAFIYEGGLIAQGTPASLRQTMSGEVIEVVATPRPEARRVLRAFPGALRVAVLGDRLHVIVPDAAAARGEIESFLVARGLSVRGLRAVEPSIEDVFIALIESRGASGGV